MATVVTEKLELPSTDANVAVIKWLRSRLPDKSSSRMGTRRASGLSSSADLAGSPEMERGGFERS